MTSVHPLTGGRARLVRWWRGPESDPGWARPALVGLLAVTALLYLWSLGANGWAFVYYSAAVQAGTRSWKAFFFGSLDAGNFITIDKAPLALWPMGISARVFGLSSWSMLVPQALMGVATVGVLYATVKRWFGAGAGLVAGAVFALTPVSTLMFRFNHPDAALTLLMTIGAYCMVRALEHGSTRWIVGGGAAIGLAFLAKELQAFLVLPAFGGVYLLAGPPRLARRIWHCVLLGLSTIAAGIWWVLIAELWPASTRPYIGGSQNNTFWDVLFGYNGLGRLTGTDTIGAGGENLWGNAAPWGKTGLERLFNGSFGAQASWLLPAALILLVAGLVWTARRPRTDRTRAALVLWGAWLIVTGLAFSLSEGIIHEYYTVALTPAIGAVIGIAGTLMWTRRETLAARTLLAVTVAVTTLWSAELLNRTPNWHPWLHDLVLVGGLLTTIALLAPPRWPRIAPTVLGLTLTIALLGPTAYSLSTATTAEQGAIPLAGPSLIERGVARQLTNALDGVAIGRREPSNQLGITGLSGSTNGLGITGFSGSDDRLGISTPPTTLVPSTPTPTPTTGRPDRGSPGNAPGIPLDGTTIGNQLRAKLTRAAVRYRWAAATVGAVEAAGYQLASDTPIMAVGGWGTDPTPSLAEFRRYVAAGEVRYFMTNAARYRGGPPHSKARAVTAWVTTHFEPRTVDDVTVYDLTQPAASKTG